MAWHQQLHELLGGLVAVLALDEHFLDVAVIDVADRPLDQVAVRMDQRRRARFERLFANLVPQASEIVEVALNLGLGDRKSVVSGQSVSVRVDLGGRRTIKKKQISKQTSNSY